MNGKESCPITYNGLGTNLRKRGFNSRPASLMTSRTWSHLVAGRSTVGHRIYSVVVTPFTPQGNRGAPARQLRTAGASSIPLNFLALVGALLAVLLFCEVMI
jgi:hypothetical protein